ncbi:MAG: hypothetical protein AMXMBFR59_40470 [Rhodanobacteraceae bacterium]
MGQPLVSVVTPLHNTAQYLSECIESVLSQTYRNLRYVVVDNASTDGSTQIAESYARTDPRMTLRRFDTLIPQVPNYNRALQQLAPESSYVKVVEADNWLYPECIEKMVALAETHPSVAIVSAYNTTETRLRFTGLPLARTFIDGREAARMHLDGSAYLFGAPTSVLMRGGFVRSRSPFYDENCPFAEDLSVCFEAFRTGDFGFVHQVLTFVRTENESILSRIGGFNLQPIDRLAMLQRHGAQFFSPSEQSRIGVRLLHDYYNGLALDRLDGKPAAYWNFHRSALQKIGMTFDRSRLRRAVIRELLLRAARPVDTLRRLLN